MRKILCCVLFCLLTIVAEDKKKEEKWDINQKRSSSREISFDCRKGTWMNLDISPDGRTIVFDLLGDIYTMPVEGGKATVIAEGIAFEVHPQFSPNGGKILFTSDRGGGDNIWMMDVDGQNKKQITQEDFRLCNNAVWMPDGQYIIAKKHFTSHRSLGAGELWMYHVSGGTGVQLTKRKNDQQDVGEPCISPDGKFVYFSEDMSPGSTFRYNKDPNGSIYMIRRYCFEKDRVENIISGAGGAVSPQVSPNGKWISFVRRVRTKSVLYVHDLETGEQWPIYHGLDKDQQETWATFGVYPDHCWMPDGKAILIWSKGKIQRVEIDGGKVREIPFQVHVRRTIRNALYFRQKVSPPTFTAKMIRHAVTSPDRKKLVFCAVGHLWLKELAHGKPRRLTDDRHFEFYPSFSRDGKEIVYATWSDQDKGSVCIFSLETKKSRKITEQPGFYHSPSFSPDGNQVVYRKGTGDAVLGYTHGKKPGIYIVSSKGGAAKFVMRKGRQPKFDRSGKRIFFKTGGEKKSLQSIHIENKDAHVHFESKYATDFVVSPDNKWLAFTELFQTYLVAFPPGGEKIDVSGKSKNLPLFHLSKDGGAYLHWSDSSHVHWTMGQQYFTRNVQNCFTWMSSEEKVKEDAEQIDIDLELKTDMPEGCIAFTNARIITMKGDEVIEKGNIVIENNRIVAIGKDIIIPKSAHVIAADGKTIIPGFVDVHAHMGTSYSGISPQQQWSYYAGLAYGVTATHDPSAYTEMVFSQSEMVKAGIMVGPRIYSTGTILYGAEGDFKAVINSLEDARLHLKRMKAVGAFSVKSYNQPRRNQRQQVLQAARELQMMVYPEGGSFLYHNLNMIIDGHTGIEHSLPVAPLYEDVVKLWSQTQVGYTPTLIVGYGGIWGENYWYQKTEVWKNEKLLRYYPRALIDSRSRRRIMIPDDDFGHIKNAESCKAIVDAGGYVQVGAHGQLHGLGTHWEIWMLAQGGFSPMEALRSATWMGVRYIGMEKEIGSLEPGKLADLVVLDKNPLENIRNTDSVRYTVINGRVYDTENMDEIANSPRKRNKFFWEYAKNNDSFPWHQETHSFMKVKCGCEGTN